MCELKELLITELELDRLERFNPTNEQTEKIKNFLRSYFSENKNREKILNSVEKNKQLLIRIMPTK